MSQSAVSTAAMAWIAARDGHTSGVALYMSRQRASGSRGSAADQHNREPVAKGHGARRLDDARATVALETASP